MDIRTWWESCVLRFVRYVPHSTRPTARPSLRHAPLPPGHRSTHIATNRGISGAIRDKAGWETADRMLPRHVVRVVHETKTGLRLRCRAGWRSRGASAAVRRLAGVLPLAGRCRPKVFRATCCLSLRQKRHACTARHGAVDQVTDAKALRQRESPLRIERRNSRYNHTAIPSCQSPDNHIQHNRASPIWGIDRLAATEAHATGFPPAGICQERRRR